MDRHLVYHFIGIGGIGMSALARIALRKGYRVQGSDAACNANTRSLEKEGAKIFLGHDASQVGEGCIIIHSSSIKKENPEWQKALALNLKILHRSEFLQQLQQGKKSLFITGTHGKTTTTGLLSSVLQESLLDPTFVIGGILHPWNTNARLGAGPFFALEADESDGSFLKGEPFGAIVTNLEREHLEYWQTDAALEAGFQQFLQGVKNKDLLFWCQDDLGLRKLRPEGVSYGFSEGASLRALRFEQKGFHLLFDAEFAGKRYETIAVRSIGRYNALNALAVFGLSLRLGIDEGAIRRAMREFGGTGRRMELVGSAAGVDFFDDYAHHPTEIEVTLQALKEAVHPRRLVAVFQPHRYTRVRDLGALFPDSFSAADLLIATDIYGGGEEKIPGVDTAFLLQKIQEKRAVTYIAREELEGRLLSYLLPGDVLVTLGAGDITYLGRKICQGVSHG